MLMPKYLIITVIAVFTLRGQIMLEGFVPPGISVSTVQYEYRRIFETLAPGRSWKSDRHHPGSNPEKAFGRAREPLARAGTNAGQRNNLRKEGKRAL